MKHLLIAALMAAASLPALAADARLSISLGDPRFYGRIEIGDYPQPRVIYRHPIMIEQRSDRPSPIYMRVPPGHAKHWDKHCREYHACGERVFFVQDGWYNRDYAPRYRKLHGRHGRGDNRQ